MIQSTTDPITWSIGVTRDPSIQFTIANGKVETRRPYYVAEFSSVESAVSLICALYALLVSRERADYFHIDRFVHS